MESNSFVIAGKNAVWEYLSTSPDKVDAVFLLDKMKKDKNSLIDHCKSNGVKYQIVPEKKLAQLTDQKHQGVVARIFFPGFLDEAELFTRMGSARLPLVLAFDQIQDSGNVGALARTLYCLQGAGIAITKDRSAFLGDRVFKTSAGAIGHLPITRVTNMARFLRQCQEKDLNIYHADKTEDSRNVYETSLELPAILVLGNENKGVRPGVIKECGAGLSIPIPNNFDSLNVAQAGAMIMGEFFRQNFYGNIQE